MARPLVAFALLVALSTATATSAAEPTDAERITARRLFLEGRRLRTQGDLPAALKALRAADAIMQVPTTAVDVATTELDLGLLVEGHESLVRATRWSGAGPVPAAYRKAQEQARALAQEVEPLIPLLEVRVAGDNDASVHIDGRVVPRAALEAPYAVNPGEHRVELFVGNDKVAEERVTLQPRQRLPVELRAPRPPAPLPPVVALSSTTRPSVVPTRSRSEAAPWVRPTALAGLTVAAAGVAVGTISGAISLGQAGEVRERCSAGRCDGEDASLLASAQSAALVSDVAFVSAGVGLAVALTAWLWPRAPVAPTVAAARGGRVGVVSVAF